MDKPIIYLDVSGGSQEALHDSISPNSSLRPHQLLVQRLESMGYQIRIPSEIPEHESDSERGLYFAFHSHKKYRRYLKRKDIRFCAYFYLEPPVVKPGKYRALKTLSSDFHKVYLPNIDGIGYSLKGVDTKRLRPVFYPQAYDNKLEVLWNKSGRKFLIMINANKRPASAWNELYGERLRAVAALARMNAIDLYGVGWRSWKKSGTYFWPYLSNRKTILSVYKGSVESKYEALSDYTFSICFENTAMPGYVTEKMFDCLLVGTIPIYLGAPDILDYVPENCFIDMRKFPSYQALYEHLKAMSAEEIETYRNNIEAYLNDGFQQHFSVNAFVEGIIADITECDT